MKKQDMKELMRYVFTGACTTLVNFIVYYIFIYCLYQSWLISNVIAWSIAVVFAFFTNKNFVFKSDDKSKKEMILFILLRLITLGIESFLLFLLIDILFVGIMVAKCAVSVVVVISNYWLCKFKIFTT